MCWCNTAFPECWKHSASNLDSSITSATERRQLLSLDNYRFSGCFAFSYFRLQIIAMLKFFTTCIILYWMTSEIQCSHVNWIMSCKCDCENTKTKEILASDFFISQFVLRILPEPLSADFVICSLKWLMGRRKADHYGVDSGREGQREIDGIQLLFSSHLSAEYNWAELCKFLNNTFLWFHVVTEMSREQKSEIMILNY